MAVAQLFLEAVQQLALVPPLERALPQPLSQLASRPQVLVGEPDLPPSSPLRDD